MGVPAIYLTKGALVAAPASTERALIVDSDGTVKTIDSTGTRQGIAGDSFIATAASAIQDLTISGLLGDTDGGYEIEGNIVTTAASPTYTLFINGATIAAGGFTAGTLNVNGTLFPSGLSTNLDIGSNPSATTCNIPFRIRMGSKSGVLQAYTVNSTSKATGSSAHVATVMSGGFTPASQITSIALHSSIAATIDVGSYIRLRKLGFLA